MTENPEPEPTTSTPAPPTLFYRVYIDGRYAPVISSYRAVRYALAAISRGAYKVTIESTLRGAPLDWQTDAPSMELLEDELMRQISQEQLPFTLIVALGQLAGVCTIIANSMQRSNSKTLLHGEAERLADAIQKVVFLLSQQEEEQEQEELP